MFDIVDIEGNIVVDKGIATTRSESTGGLIRRRVLRVEDESGGIIVTVWNKKV